MGSLSVIDQPRAVDAAAISGVVVEVRDLSETQAFYEPLFRDARGQWESGRTSLTFRARDQRVEFVQRSRPRTLGDTGVHQAYRVAPARLHALAHQLTRGGATVNWWHEDYPSERELSAYVEDPSGNLVQLLAHAQTGQLIDHVGLAVDDLEYASLFYEDSLGATISYYHGFRTVDVLDVRSWSAGDDQVTPWLRQGKYSIYSHRVEGQPALQLHVDFGPTRLALIMSGKRVPEPPEEQVRGTPQLVLHASTTADQAAKSLRGLDGALVSHRYARRRLPLEVEGSSIFLRDPSGYFVRLECEA